MLAFFIRRWQMETTFQQVRTHLGLETQPQGSPKATARTTPALIRVIADEARIIHQEHQPITLPRGDYRVWQQREYTPEKIRRITD